MVTSPKFCVRWRPLPTGEAAAATLSAPWPSTKGLPVGPGLVVPNRLALTSLGASFGLALRMRAAAQAVMAELKEVPDPTKLLLPMTAEGFWTSTVDPGARRLTTDRPGATRSGLNKP